MNPPPAPGQRLESLDVFRGITVAAMILVSTPGTWDAVYWPLDHAAWNGWTPTDLVFPFFLFAMGAAVPIALSRARPGGGDWRLRVIRRGLTLAALGIVLNAIEATSWSWTTFRIPGVLQRIGLVYIVVALLTQHTKRETWGFEAALLLVGYWALMRLVPVPGYGAGVLTPEGSLASFVDQRIVGAHLAFATWDPEGPFSTIPAIATALCGALAGDWLLHPGTARHRSTDLWIAGAIATVIGLLWDRAFPINKNLWTSSFALFSAGLAAQLLALCHWVLDVHQWRGWSLPFKAFGQNALAAYFLSIGVDVLLARAPIVSGWDSAKDALFWNGVASWIQPTELASLGYAVAYTVFWGGVLVVLYRHRIFIKI